MLIDKVPAQWESSALGFVSCLGRPKVEKEKSNRHLRFLSVNHPASPQLANLRGVHLITTRRTAYIPVHPPPRILPWCVVGQPPVINYLMRSKPRDIDSAWPYELPKREFPLSLISFLLFLDAIISSLRVIEGSQVLKGS